MTTLQPDQNENLDTNDILDLINADDERLQNAAERARQANAGFSSGSSPDSPSTETVTTSIFPTSTPTATPTTITSPPPAPDESSSSSSGLTKAQLGGAAAGAVVVLILIGLGLFFCIRRCRKPKKKLKNLETQYSTLEDALSAEREEKNENPVEIADGNVLAFEESSRVEGGEGTVGQVVVEAPGPGGMQVLSELDSEEGIAAQVWRGLKSAVSDD